MRELLCKDAVFKWTNKQEQALQSWKDIVLQNATLIYPDHTKPFTVWIDAAKSGLGYALSQQDDKRRHTFVSFSGRACRTFERSYSAVDLEITGLIAAITQFHIFLVASPHPTVMKTDHLSLTYLQSLKNAKGKLLRYSLFLQDYNLKIEHLPGKTNQLADCLSRREYDHDHSADQTPLLGINTHDFLNAIDVFEDNSNAHSWRRKLNCLRIILIKPAIIAAVTTRRQRSRQPPPIDNINPSPSSSVDSSPIAPYFVAQPSAQPTNDTAAQAFSGPPAITDITPDDIIDDQEHMISHQRVDSEVKIDLTTQSDDPFLRDVIHYLHDGTLPSDKQQATQILVQIDDFHIQNNQLVHLANIRTKRLNQIRHRWTQLCVRRQYRVTVMKCFHELNHSAFLKSYLSAKQRLWWPGMCQDFKLYVEGCLTCQQTKSFVARQKFPLTSNPVIPDYFSHVHIDHHKMSTPSHGYQYVFIVIDAATGCVQLAATKGTTAEESANMLFIHWISRYGLITRLYSDRHASFLSKLMTSSVKLGVAGKSVFTSGHRPQCNSSAELVCKQIIQYIRSYAMPHENWSKLLPAICCANRYLVNSTVRVSPFFAMYGFNMPLSLDLQLLAHPEKLDAKHAVIHFSSELDVIRKIIAQNRADVRITTEQRFNKDAVPHPHAEGMRAFLRAHDTPKSGNLKHSKQFVGSYIILEVRGPLVRLQHLYTAKILPHYTNVEMLRPLKDSCDIVYNRTKPIDVSSDTL